MYYVGVGVFFVIVFFGMTFLHNWRDARRERLGMVPRVAQFQDRDADTEVIGSSNQESCEYFRPSVKEIKTPQYTLDIK
ncbi:hypothetical protein HDU81_009115 [Chytriomyces hyalinus]|nr:hypothetical protein HDU81_009115 [Chytriomyces hyalinus]